MFSQRWASRECRELHPGFAANDNRIQYFAHARIASQILVVVRSGKRRIVLRSSCLDSRDALITRILLLCTRERGEPDRFTSKNVGFTARPQNGVRQPTPIAKIRPSRRPLGSLKL